MYLQLARAYKIFLIIIIIIQMFVWIWICLVPGVLFPCVWGCGLEDVCTAGNIQTESKD